MCKLLLPSILFLLSLSHGLSQKSISGLITDTLDHPIPYVNLGVSERGIGTVSDNEGKFSVEFLREGDLLNLSAIGYEDVTISYEQLYKKVRSGEDLVIKLKSKDYIIEGVNIVGKRIKSREVRIGSLNKKRGHSIGFGSKQLGSEVGARLHFDNPTLITSFHFVVNHAKGDSMLFRLKIYQFNGDIVGQQILNENILIREAQSKGSLGVDLSHLGLILKGSHLFSLEWVQDIDGNGNEGISFDTRSERRHGGTFMKISSVGSIERVSYLESKRPCFYILGTEYESP